MADDQRPSSEPPLPDEPNKASDGNLTPDPDFLESDRFHFDDEPMPRATVDEELDPIQLAQDSLRQFEAQTLAQAFGQFFRTPRRTWSLLQTVLSTPVSQRHTAADFDNVRTYPPPNQGVRDPIDSVVTNKSKDIRVGDLPEGTDLEEQPLTPAERQREAMVISLRISLILVAWLGNDMITPPGLGGTTSQIQLGVWILIGAAIGWLAVELLAHQTNFQQWLTDRRQRETSETEPKSKGIDPTRTRFSLEDGIHPVRIVLFLVGIVTLMATVAFTRDNQFTVIGFFAWMMSIISFSTAFASDRFLFEPRPAHFQIPTFWTSWTFYALVIIVIVGAVFRLSNLEATPGQMTSDHVEKLLDAQRVIDGNQQVFFPNNGGREAFQMYAMAALTQLPGINMNFTALKLLSALEGLLTLPFLWWLGREVIGKDQRKLGNIVGLTLAALVAVSGWHTSLSRLALRIVLTPLMASWMFIYLGRGMRFNQRDEFLKAGLVLGAGLYMYQAVRMLPVVVIVGVFIAVVARVRSWAALRDYAVNFGALVFTSFIVFVPLFGFSLQFPDLFWRRTTGRLLGDSMIQQVQPDGTIVAAQATLADQLAAFQANLPVLGDNIRNAFLMYNYRGDGLWFSNAPNVPHMDTLVGGLLILGLAAWIVRIIRRRDVVDILVPVTIFIMLLPSALSIAFPNENPSATRTSGTLPFAYLLAAYPLALILQSITRLTDRKRLSMGLGTVVIALVMTVSYSQNARTYFQDYHSQYLLSSLPYAQAGDDIRQFTADVGTEGNTFMIAYPFWWDHRALGLEAGLLDYPNGILSLDDVPQFLYDSFQRTGRYAFDPEQDILFFFSTDDDNGEITATQLREWFPNGVVDLTFVEAQNRSYATYRAPAPGQDGFINFLRENGIIAVSSE
jgi:hypothetical protein